MTAAVTDLLKKTYNAANPNVARVTATRAISGTTLTCDNLAGWPTDTAVSFSTYKVNASNVVIAGTQIDWVGIVAGNNVGTLTRITGASDGGSAIGDVVEMNPTANWANDLVTNVLTHANQDGTLKTDAVTTTVIKDANVTTAKLADGAVTMVKVANPYKFSAYRNAAQSPSGGVIQYDTENFDTNNNFDVTTNKGRYTAPVSGFYQFNVISSQIVTAAPQDPNVQLRKNGTTGVGYGHFVNMYNGASAGSVYIAALIQLTAGDYVEVLGGTLPLDVTTHGYNVFSGFLVSET